MCGTRTVHIWEGAVQIKRIVYFLPAFYYLFAKAHTEFNADEEMKHLSATQRITIAVHHPPIHTRLGEMASNLCLEGWRCAASNHHHISSTQYPTPLAIFATSERIICQNIPAASYINKWRKCLRSHIIADIHIGWWSQWKTKNGREQCLARNF